MYCFDNVEYKQWDEWCGQLAIGIDNMVDYFLSRLTARDDGGFIFHGSISLDGGGFASCRSLITDDVSDVKKGSPLTNIKCKRRCAQVRRRYGAYKT